MRRIYWTFLLLIAAMGLGAQTYVWKNGRPMLENPDSITFVKPDLGLQVRGEYPDGKNDWKTIDFYFLTKDYRGNAQWQSARMTIPNKQWKSKHIRGMAMYNHYTIMRSDECPTADYEDLQRAARGSLAVVSADYEGFGLTADRVQAYCFGEANARASIDALLAAREWLRKEGFTLSDTIINYGYSQGGQTTVAALKLSQTEYRGKVRFTRSYAGGGPHNLTLTYRKFIEWKKWGLASALPLTVITLNELYHLRLNYRDVFLSPLAEHWKMWFISKKFGTYEAQNLMGVDSIHHFMKPVFCDSTSAEVKRVTAYTDAMKTINNWQPDPDTELMLIHSRNDDVVPFENSREMYQFLKSQGCEKVTIDSTYLTKTHEESGVSFVFWMLSEINTLLSH